MKSGSVLGHEEEGLQIRLREMLAIPRATRIRHSHQLRLQLGLGACAVLKEEVERNLIGRAGGALQLPATRGSSHRRLECDTGSRREGGSEGAKGNSDETEL